VLISGWRAFFPKKVTTEQRLKQFPATKLPLEADVTIYWDNYQIPFIIAENDNDAAFTLGLVHQHLRGAQIAILKRVTQGRFSEMAGPVAAKIDAALKTLDIGYAADSMIEAMSPQTRKWMENFLAGLNYYQEHTDKTPPEYGLLGIEPEPYTMQDMMYIGRLLGADVNWFVYFAALGSRDKPGWPELWSKMLDVGMNGPASLNENKSLDELRSILSDLSRSGSNSIVIRPEKSAYDAAIIANDPHLGITVPNLFLLAGYKCPSYHCVGMMIPGLPFMALGRNPDLAWGGTNMRSANSDLYDITKLKNPKITSESKKVKVRWWFDKEINVRRTEFGPIMSDADIFPSAETDTLALNWVGHQGSDDIGAFLRANKAKNTAEFVESFRGYAVSGQNMLVVDNSGNIAMTLATRLPIRRYDRPPDVVLDPTNPDHLWHGFLEAPELPIGFNPVDNFIASANNKPAKHNPPIGYFFSEAERINRLNDLVSNADKVDLELIKKLQTDVYSEFSERLAGRWLEQIEKHALEQKHNEIYDELKKWDGYYHAESRGPVAFEALTYTLAERLLADKGNNFLYRNWSYIAHYLADDLDSLPDARQKELLDSSLTDGGKIFRKYKSWGEMHRLAVQYLLGRVPIIGSLFRYRDFPVSGSRETVMKTNHELVKEKSYTSYGSQSRHISIMDDPDNNYFILLGGNDGWLGSDNMLDQIDLWRDVSYIKLPLRVENAKKRASFEMDLSPSGPIEIKKLNIKR